MPRPPETENSQIELLANRTARELRADARQRRSIDQPAPPPFIAALKKAGSGPIAAWQAKASPEAPRF